MCTQQQKRERLDVVLELLLLGYQRREILQSASKLGWLNGKGEPVSDRTVDTYIHEANAELEALATIDRQREIGKARARLEKLFNKSFQIQDYKTARAIQKDISDLFGLDAPKKKELTGKDGKDLIPDAAAALDAKLAGIAATITAADGADDTDG